MKKLIYLLVGFCLMTATSCIDIIEEMYLKKNGSGKYVITMDMSALMEAGTKEMLEGMAQEEGQEGESAFPAEQDTTMYFSDAPDSLKQKLSHPEILDKVYVHTSISEKDEKMIIQFAIDFDNIKEIDYFLEDLDKLQGENKMAGLGGAGGAGGGGGLFPSGSSTKSLFKLAKRKFTRLPAEKPEETMDSEEMQMAKMFFADANYKAIYHFPGKIKKTTMKDAKIDGKTLTMEVSLLDIMEGKAALEGDICFKKK